MDCLLVIVELLNFTFSGQETQNGPIIVYNGSLKEAIYFTLL